jgi:hypothetical protein
MKDRETHVVGKMQVIQYQNDGMLLGYCAYHLEKGFG